MRRVRAVAVLAALLVIAHADGMPAAKPTDAQLLARYSPVLVLHPAERFAPIPVDGVLADADVTQQDATGAWVPVPGPLPTSGGPWRLDQRGCSAADGLAAVDCYAALDAARADGPLAYGAVHRRGSRIALQYWLFYRYDLYSPQVPQTADFWQAHEGDWEMVTVLLDAKAKPVVAGYSRHCAGARRNWAKVPKRGTHPLVYVALGSHANYFGPGSAPLEKRCWPKEALIVFNTYKQPLVDFTARGRTIAPEVVEVRTRNPSWMTYPGAWGETQWIHFPKASLAYRAGPTGPAFKAIWRNPVSEPLSWPRG